MDNDETAPSPWTRPGFVAAVVVIALVLILGGVLAIKSFRAQDDRGSAKPSTSSSSSTTSAAPTPSATNAPASSICGLGGVAMTGTVTSAPAATWAYQGTIAYPTSTTYGPGKTNAAGVRYCFQHSPEGALFAAANAAVQATDATVIGPWLDYFVAQGPHRDALVTAGGASSSASGSRMVISGFRILSYGGGSARVDVGLKVAAGGPSVFLSAVYDLTWEAGDWKLVVSDPKAPVDFAKIPDLAGYVSWAGA